MSNDLYEIEVPGSDSSPPYRYTITAEQYQGLVEANRRAEEAGLRQIHHDWECELEFGTIFVNGEEYAGHSQRVTSWIVDGLLPTGYLAVLGATSKAGKTCFATALAMSIATGEPFLGKEVRAGAVLWCAYEESESERFTVLKQWPEHPYRLYTTHKNPLIDDPEGLNALKYWLYKTDAKLIVIDPLYGATSAESLSDGRAARRALSGLKEICRKYHCAALVLHHITKDVSIGMTRERFADSNQILATASMDMLMDSTDLEEGGRLLKISCRGRGEFANQTLFVKSTGVTHYELVENQAEAASGFNQMDAKILKGLRNAPEPIGSTDLASRLRLNPQSVRNRLGPLTAKGLVKREGKRGRTPLYRANE